MNQIAIWLDTFFAPFDSAILQFMHTIAEKAGVLMTPFMHLVSLTGEKGFMMLLIALILMCFPKTCVFGAVCCGALFTNIILKPTVCRIRPYEASELYRSFWEYTGATIEGEYSFPSGHTTAAMAGTRALALTRGKKYVWICISYVILMGASRNYLMVHYPSDILGGMIAGAAGAIIAYFITKAIYKYATSSPDKKLSSFVLNADIRNLIKSK